MILDRDMTMYILHIIFFVSTTSKQSAKLVDLKWLPLRDASRESRIQCCNRPRTKGVLYRYKNVV